MATNYTEKIAKVEEAIAKKITLIEKREKQISKNTEIYNKLATEYGFQTITDCHAMPSESIRGFCSLWHEQKIEYKPFETAYESYHKIEDAVESIENARKSIEEKKQIIANYQSKMANDQKRYDLLAEMPKCFIDFRDEIVAEQDAYDIGARNHYHQIKDKRDEAIQNIRHRYFAKEIDYSEKDRLIHEAMETYELPMYFSFFDYTDEMIHADNMKHVTDFVINTCHKVIAITGEITDTQSVFLTRGNQNRTVINGFIIGKDGKAELETIECAGYNIVRWHLRTIVHDRS